MMSLKTLIFPTFNRSKLDYKMNIYGVQVVKLFFRYRVLVLSASAEISSIIGD